MEEMHQAINHKIDLQTQKMLGTFNAGFSRLERRIERCETQLEALSSKVKNCSMNIAFLATQSSSHILLQGDTVRQVDNTEAASASAKLKQPRRKVSSSSGISSLQHNSPPPANFRICRSITTVLQLWDEWHNGINGNMPVVSFLSKFGHRALSSAGD